MSACVSYFVREDGPINHTDQTLSSIPNLDVVLSRKSMAHELACIIRYGEEVAPTRINDMERR